MTAINKMRERVKVYRIEKSGPDNIGGVTTTKTLLGTFWARVENDRGVRYEGDRTIKNSMPVKITMRANSSNITVEDLIEYNNKDYTISSVIIDEEKRFTICQAQGLR
jgi:head-tail adaptor